MRLLPKDPHLGWTRLAWLIYLAFLFLPPAIDHSPARVWLATLAAAAIFLPLYLWGFWLTGRRLLWIVAALFVLGAVLAPLNTGSAAFVIYAAGFLGKAGRPRFGAACLAALLAALAPASWALHLPPEFWLVAAPFALVVGGVNIHFAEIGRANARLSASHQEIEKLAKTAERERIARDLHDLLGHTLSVITLKSELASRLAAGDPERAAAEMREVERISRQALREVRSAVSGYRSEGLTAELARARLALESSGIRPEYFTMPVELGAAAESALAFALREAVTNVVRHSGARTCTILLEQQEGVTRLEVRDDGDGGKEAAAGSGEEAHVGTGLASMRERVAGLGGQLELRTAGGTTLTITLPARPFSDSSAAPAAPVPPMAPVAPMAPMAPMAPAAPAAPMAPMAAGEPAPTSSAAKAIRVATSTDNEGKSKGAGEVEGGAAPAYLRPKEAR